MINRSVGQFFRVRDLNFAQFADKIALIADLTAAFRVKWRAIQNYSCIFAVVKLIDQFSFFPHRKNFRRRAIFIAGQMFCVDIQKVGNVKAFIGCASRSGAISLLLHRHFKAFFVRDQIIFLQNFFRQLKRESERVVEFKANFAAQFRFFRRFSRFNFARQNFHSLRQCRRESVFFKAHDFFNVAQIFAHFLEIGHFGVDFSDFFYCAFQKCIFYAQHAPMTNCTPQNSAQNIAAPLI